MILILTCVVVGGTCLTCGLAWGYTLGVKDTERRWSDAVGRSGSHP